MTGKLHILDSSGHTEVPWDTETPTGPLDPAYAASEFDRLVAGGHLAFSESPTGKKVQLKKGEFDPSVHSKVTVTPQFCGG